MTDRNPKPDSPETSNPQGLEDIRRERDLLRLYLDTVETVIVALEESGAITSINKTGCRILGYSEEELIGRSWFETCLPQPDGQANVYPVFLDLMAGRIAAVEYFENPIITKAGEIRYIAWHNALLRNDRGSIIGTISSGNDVTERKLAEESYRSLFNEMLDGFALHEIICDDEGRPVDYRYITVNPSFERITGLKAVNIIGRRVTEILPGIEQHWIETYGKVALTGEPAFFENYAETLKKYFEAKAFRPAVNQFACIFADITERKQTEEELKAWMSRYELIVAASGQVAYEYTVGTGRITWGASIEKVLGYTLEEIAGGITQWQDLLHPDDRQTTIETLTTAEKACSYWDATYRMRHKRGDYVWIRDRGFFLPDGKGNACCQLGMMEDINEQKRAEGERIKLEEQLRQAQKMESIGRLAGGVAHDFNNMLAVIIGHAELALDHIDPGTPACTDLQAIRKATEHSAGLVRHLLAFARKQTIAPKVINLNETVQHMFNILKRLIGEDIDLTLKPQEHLWQVCIDPGQVDQILANLCVNARDAIAGQGQIILETGNVTCNERSALCYENVPVGDYVLLSVSDSGCGMDDAMLGKIFEPFFTTKEVGKGSGLGLSTVYGIVTQNNGFINVRSAPGRGSTFHIYLPRHFGDQENKKAAAQAAQAETGHETIMLVEDEPSLLKMTETMLLRLGYVVLTALTPEEAVRQTTRYNGNIHLLITDVIMPDMNGRDLAERIQAIRPGMRCLFMSGYTADVIARQGVLDEGVQFIQKPFSKKVFAAKVREVLDASETPVEKTPIFKDSY